MSEQDGFTLFEALIATLLLAIAVLTTVATLDSSRSQATAAEREQAAVHAAEEEIERIRSLGYAAVWLRAAPAPSGDADDPNHSVTSGGGYRWDAVQGADGPVEPLVIGSGTSGAGLDSTGPTWGNSRIGGRLYRYVTWMNDSCATCTGTQDYKRVTVAVTLNGDAEPRKPIVTSTIMADPSAVSGS